MPKFLVVLNPITLGFIAVICVVGIIFLFWNNRKTTELGPTLLTTIGIFGTFVGIALGLYNFDTGNVEASIPALLDGLKTAFFASVFGVGFAILLKLREFFIGVKIAGPQDAAPDDVTAADLVRHLRDIRTALTGGDDGSLISQIKLARQDSNERLAPLQAIQKGLLGTEDGSLLTQMRLLRQDSNDRLDKLSVAMREALEKLSEMGSKALIEALRGVIKDFNDKITEQFGENFKHLNTAVGNLLVWQDQYKATVETTVAKLAQVSATVGDLANSFTVMVDRSGRFADVADRLGTMLTALEAGERRLKEQSEALATLLLKASGSLPEIERKIEELSTQMANAVRENQRIVGAAMTESATVLRGAVEVLARDVSTTSTQLSASIIQNQQVVTSALTDNATAIRASVQTGQKAIEVTTNEFERQLVGLVARAQEQMAALSTELGGIVTRNQETVSKALTENAAAIRASIEGAQRGITETNAAFNQQLRELADRTKEQVAAFSADLGGAVTKNQETVSKALTENAAAIRGSIESAQRDMTETNTAFNRQLRELADKTKEQVATLDAALATELQKALQSLAQQFTAISGRFAADYGPLADNLRRIVELGRVGR